MTTLRDLTVQATRVRQMGVNARSGLNPNSGPLDFRIQSAYGWSGHLVVESQKLRLMIKNYADEQGVELPR